MSIYVEAIVKDPYLLPSRVPLDANGLALWLALELLGGEGPCGGRMQNGVGSKIY